MTGNPSAKPAETPGFEEMVTILLDEQVRLWNAGTPKAIEEIAQANPNLDPEVLLHLIYQEAVLRENLGQSVTVEEYIRRFPRFADDLLLQFEVDSALDNTGVFPPGVLGEDSDLPLPHFPGYEIQSVLGRGGMGVVYKARDTRLNRWVALKVMLAGAHAGPETLSRFRREAEAIARLQHPNIVQIFEIGDQGGTPYLALELVEGNSLARQIGGRPMPIAKAVRLAVTVAEALAYCHSKGVVHRDLTPGNILMAGEVPRITDFGLARRTDLDEAQTRSGVVMGTPSYMAPEQAGGKARQAGPQADVYAVGAVLYECLTGQPPFKAPTAVETILQVLSEEPPPPRRHRAEIPRDLSTICLKCLRKEPEQRYPTAWALADDLGRFLAGKPVLARPVGPVGKLSRWAKRKPGIAALLATVFLLLAGGLVITSTMLARERKARSDATTAQSLAESRANDLRDAAERLNKANNHIDIGRVWASIRMYRTAMQEFRQAAALRPDHSAAWRESGLLAAQLYLWDDASHDLDTSFRFQEPSDSTLWRYLALVHAARGDTARQAEVAAKMVSHLAGQANPIGACDLIRTCALCDAKIAEPEVLEALGRLAEAALPYSPWTPTHAGLLHLATGRPVEAVSRLQAALDHGGSWAITRPVLALALFRCGRVAESRAELANAERVADTWFRDRAQTPDGFLPVSWAEWIEFETARRLASREIRGVLPGPEDRLASLRGRTFQILGQTEEATREFDAAVFHRPKDPQARLERCRFRLQKGDTAGAGIDFALGLTAGHSDRDFLLVAIRTMAEQGAWQLADLACARLAQLDADPSQVPLFQEAGEVAFKGARWLAAARLFEKAAQAAPTDWALRARIGDCRFFLDDPSGARDAYAKAAEGNPSHPGYREALGHAHAECLEWDAAEEAFRRASELQPGWNSPVRHLALVKWAKGDHAAIPSLLKDLGNRPSTASDPSEATAFLYLALSIGGTFDPDRLRSIAATIKKPGPESHRLQVATLYRCGELAQARSRIEEFRKTMTAPRAWDLLFHSLVHSALKENEAARHTFDQALVWIEEASRPAKAGSVRVRWVNWAERVMVDALRQEAETKLVLKR